MNGAPIPGREVDRALADQVLREWKLPLVAHLVLFGMVAFLVWDVVPTSLLIPWGGAIVAIAVVRAVFTTRARRMGIAPGAVARTIRVTMFTLGLAWGIGTAFAAQYLTIGTLAVVLVALAGLLSGGIATLVGDRWALVIYSAAMFGPAIVGVFLIAQQRPEAITTVLLVIFVAFTVRLHRQMHETLRERLLQEEALRAALGEVKTLRGILRICSNCKRVRTDSGAWEDVDSYVREHTNAEFSHGLCPDCAKAWSAH